MKKAVYVLLAFVFSAHYAIAAVFCSTKVDQIYLDASGLVVVHGTAAGASPYAGWQALCNVNTGDSVLICNSWLAFATSALDSVSGTLLQTTYPGLDNCNQIPGLFPIPSAVTILK